MLLILLLLFLFKVTLNERHQVQASSNVLANLNEQHQVQASSVFVLIGNVCSAGTSILLDARNAINAVASGLQTALLSNEFHIASQ